MSGDSLPRSNIKEVADRAGVAISSVSRVMSGHPDVSAKMRERVFRAARELGYKPDLLAQGLRLRYTHSIGFVVGDISNPLLAEIVKGAEATLRDAGYSMLLTNSEGDANMDAEHVGVLERRRVDGMLLSLASEQHTDTLNALRALDVPVVVIDRDLPADVRASAVLSDHRQGMRAAVTKLLELGHRRIGLIAGPHVRPSTEREAALAEACAQFGVPPTYTISEGSFDHRHATRATRQMLDAPDPATALIIGGNQLLSGALSELARRRMVLGRDISLVSCDTVPLSELFEPPIAVVRRDTDEIGRVAARLLLERLGAPDAEPHDVVLPTEFVMRASCGPVSSATNGRDRSRVTARRAEVA
jgi:LacI family transcriptional regulator